MFKIYGTFRTGQDKRFTYAKYERPSFTVRVITNVQKKVKGNSKGQTFKIYGTIGKTVS